MVKSEPFTTKKIKEDNFSDNGENNYYTCIENYALLVDLQAGAEYLKEFAYCKKCENRPVRNCFQRHPIWVTVSWLDFQKAFSGIFKQK